MSESPSLSAPADGAAEAAEGQVRFAPAGVRFLLWVLAIGFGTWLAWLGLLHAGWPALAHPAVDELRGVWLGDGLMVLAGVLVAARAVLRTRDRWAWAFLAVGIVTWALGDIVWDAWVRGMDPLPWPSVADVLYLALYPCIYVALVMLVRNRISHPPRSVWTDGLTVAIGVSAYAWIAVSDVLAHGPADGWPAVITNAAYPIGDLITLSMLVAILSVLGWPTDRMWALLSLGCASFAVMDTVQFVRVAHGDEDPGDWLNLGWLASALLIAFAAWARPREASPQIHTMRVAIVPLVVVTGAFALLLYGNIRTIPTASAFLAAVAIVAAGVRAAQIFRHVSLLAGRRQQAQTDTLTGLGNRRLLYQRMDDALADRQPGELVALILLNLDGFREVNDSFGHAAGDAVLRQVGSRLRDLVGRADTIARLGGDEFAVLLCPPGRIGAVAAFVARVEEAMAAPFSIADMQAEIGMSAGVAVCPDHAATREGLLGLADAAMGRAKRSHAAHVVFDPDLDGFDRGKLRMIQDLREGIKNGELVCHYQPKLDLADNKVHEVEVLVRWEHPRDGLIFPDMFVPLAEHAGLMRSLTEHVLNRAIAQAAEWRERRMMVSVAVNMSMTNLLDLGLPDTVAGMLQHHHLPPQALKLEVTETVLMADPERAKAVVDGLHRLGIAISVDDYGKEYSSLGKLRELEAQEIKLDASLVTGIADRQELQAIMRSTVDLAHELGMQLVAEGVETASDLKEVKRLGCDVAQGFFVHRPGSAVDITRWMRTRAARSDSEGAQGAQGAPGG